MTEDVHAAVQANDAQHSKESRRLLGAVAAVATVLAVLAFLVLDAQQRAQSKQILRQNQITSQRIDDCTTVGGRCYEAGSARSAEVIGELIRSNMAIAVCSKSTDTETELQMCYRKRMAPSVTP